MKPYNKYLKSKDWEFKKKLKYLSSHKRCGICGGTEELNLHHLNYKNLFDVENSDLRVLCRRCHFLAHDLMKEGKIVFRSNNHNSKFAILKAKVKKALGITKLNMFKKEIK